MPIAPLEYCFVSQRISSALVLIRHGAGFGRWKQSDDGSLFNWAPCTLQVYIFYFAWWVGHLDCNQYREFLDTCLSAHLHSEYDGNKLGFWRDWLNKFCFVTRDQNQESIKLGAPLLVEAARFFDEKLPSKIHIPPDVKQIVVSAKKWVGKQ